MTEAAKNGVGIKLPPAQIVRFLGHAKSLTPFSLASSHAPLLGCARRCHAQAVPTVVFSSDSLV
jgi:hypothetical protein